jgi:hypothetical protein
MDQEITPTPETGMELQPLPNDIVLTTTHATRIPFAEISLLSSNFASIGDAMRTATTTIDLGAMGYYQCINEGIDGLKQARAWRPLTPSATVTS